ncbi:allergen Tha p 1-like isoform X1 [Schistocerca serialis cubense]|uniref:allergen Tha p 1-like isoform X1 n=1 Tax=Schistocerca serialis cubense TaxID=2023355 RepID=UPI00214E51BC|nr:allergen Tha p 1-like isoform X1 [Schistocerca serialis cubense]XP_049963734.1 allergen Tha p 1-like isoform X1 [Schistocerca serialis cubense]
MARLHVVLALAGLVLAVHAEIAAAGFFAPAVLDVDSPKQNEEAFQDTMRCVLSRDDYKFCGSNSVSIKYTMWRLLEKGCNSCAEDERKVYSFMAYLSNNRPNEWQQVLSMYDPQGDFKRKNGDQWKEYGVLV